MNARFWFNAGCVALGLVLFWTMGYPLWNRAVSGENDFLQLYAGARLVGTPDLYNIEASRAIERQAAPSHTVYPSIYYNRLPFYALLLKPLGALPYRQAYFVYQAVSLLMVITFLVFYIRLYPELITLAALSVPLLTNFLNGQDSGIVTSIAGFSMLLHRRGKDFLAGAILSLAAIKFHLFFLVAIAVLIHRKWDMAKGGLAGGAALILLSIAADGVMWPMRLLATVSTPDPGHEHMTTFRNLSWFLSGRDNKPLELMLSLAVILLFAYTAYKIKDFVVVFGVAISAGLVVCIHAYTPDLMLLLLAVALFATSSASPALRGITMIAALPPTCFLLFAGFPYSIAVPLLLTSILLTALVFDAHQGQSSAAPGNPDPGQRLGSSSAAHG